MSSVLYKHSVRTSQEHVTQRVKYVKARGIYSIHWTSKGQIIREWDVLNNALNYIYLGVI
jgi:hypothetical protein